MTAYPTVCSCSRCGCNLHGEEEASLHRGRRFGLTKGVYNVLLVGRSDALAIVRS